MAARWVALLALAVSSWVPLAIAQTAPPDIDPQSGFRLPLPKRDDLDEAGKRIYDRLNSPSGGSIVGLRGPGGIQLYDLKLSELSTGLNTYLRREAGLSAHVREVAILITAREFSSQFEWAAHEPEALKEGVPAATIDAIKQRKGLDGVDEPDAIIIALGREMFGVKQVSSATFARAQKQFGPRGVLDIVALMGNYAGTAALLAAYDMQLPAGQNPLLPMP